MELIRALACLVERPTPEGQRLADLLQLGRLPEPSEHSDLFLFQLQPYLSIYLGEEGMLGGEARDRVAGFWRVLGETPPAEPDHLTALLGLYASLADLESESEEARAGWRHARKALLWEHLLSWLPPYLSKLQEVAPPSYRRWGELLLEVLVGDGEQLGLVKELPLHLRQAPEMADPRAEGGDALLDSLLSPVRSGMVLIRADLERAARELDLGLRRGERRFVLEALLGQEPAPVLDWLAGEADQWAGRHRRQPPRLSSLSRWWSERAAATHRLLTELVAEA